MNADAPQTPREALELKLTALILDELPADEAFELGRKLEHDAELRQLYERLQIAMRLVRETTKAPAQTAATAPAEPLRMNAARREKLLAQFKTIEPKEFEQDKTIKIRWIELAAVIAILGIISAMLLPTLSRSKTKGQHFANNRLTARPTDEFRRKDRAASSASPQTRGYGEAVVANEPQRITSLPSSQATLAAAPPPPKAESRPGSSIFLPSTTSESESANYGVTLSDGANRLNDFSTLSLDAAGKSELAASDSAFRRRYPSDSANQSGLGVNENKKVDELRSSLFDEAPQDRKNANAGWRETVLARKQPATEAPAEPGLLGDSSRNQPLSVDPATGLPVTSAGQELNGHFAVGGTGGGGGGGGGGVAGGVLAAQTDSSEGRRDLGRRQLSDSERIAGESVQLPSVAAEAANGITQMEIARGAGVVDARPAAGRPLQPEAQVKAGAEFRTKLQASEGDKDVAVGEKLAYAAEPLAPLAAPQPNTPPPPGVVESLPAQKPAKGGVTFNRRYGISRPAQAAPTPSPTPSSAGVPATAAKKEVEDRFYAERGDNLGKSVEAAKVAPEVSTAAGRAPERLLRLAKNEEKGKAAASPAESDQKLAEQAQTPRQGNPSNINPSNVVGYYSLQVPANFKSVTTNQLLAPADKLDDAPKARPAAPVLEPQPEIQTADNAYSTFSLNVSDVSFKLAGASLERGLMPEAASVRSEEFLNAFDYRDPEPAPGIPVAFNWERARDPFQQNRDFLRFSIKTGAQGRESGKPMNIVLLLDNSGSMERADRVRILREALRVLAAQMQPQDRFSVITFARSARLWVDGATGSEAPSAVAEVGGLTPEGGTNLEEAMNLGYQTALRHYVPNGVNRVVLLTDGAANLGNLEPEALKAKVEAHRKQGVALDCFGIGWEGYNDDLLEVLSRNGDGRYGFLNSAEAAGSEFAQQLAGALKVAASDVKVQVQFNPERVTVYRQIGYAKHQLTKEQFRDNTVDAAELGAAEAGNALYVIQVNPTGRGPCATVRARYRIPGTSDYREQEWVVPYHGPAMSLEQASPAMRLAVVSSEFAEWLVSSPYAADVTPDALLGYLRGVPEVSGADARPKKLEWMVRQAKSITGN